MKGLAVAKGVTEVPFHSPQVFERDFTDIAKKGFIVARRLSSSIDELRKLGATTQELLEIVVLTRVLESCEDVILLGLDGEVMRLDVEATVSTVDEHMLTVGAVRPVELVEIFRAETIVGGYFRLKLRNVESAQPWHAALLTYASQVRELM